MPEKAQPKISIAEAVLIGLFLAILDALDLIPIFGDLTDVAGAPIWFYYVSKHINGIAYIIAEVLDAIPVVQEFPSRSIVWWVTVAIDRLVPKKLEEALEKSGELEQGGEGGAELEAGASEGAAGAEAAAEGGAQEGQALNAGEQEAQIEEQEETTSKSGSSQEEGGAEDKGQKGEGNKGEDEEDIMADKNEGDPMKEEAKDIFEEVDGGDAGTTSADQDKEEEDEEEPPATGSKPSNVVGIDSSKQWQAAQKQRTAQPPSTPIYDVKPKKEKKAA